MKKSFKHLLLIVSALALLLCAVACGSVKSISVSEDHAFQTTYVLGQELNLSGGVLKVDTGKKVNEVPLDSKDVTVSGYDKDLLGKQTVTIEYEGVTTEITVTVVENLTVNNALVDYLVGDSFDKSKGNVKITSSDGTSRMFPLSSDIISISGFDSSTAKSNLELKVVCTLDGQTYEGNMKVNVHAIESVEFRRPNKITYTSHYQGDVDVTGGRFILKGNGGAIRREVAISESMMENSGFDVGAVNATNSPLKQIITVTYNGTPYTYEIQLTYTDVTMFLENAEKVLGINWAGASIPVIDAEVGELALDLMRAYVDMIPADRVLISEELAFNVARTAMVYGYEIWYNDIGKFEGVFAIESGKTVLYLESYDKVKASLDLFDDKDSAMYTLAPLLLQIIELYGDKVIYENETAYTTFSSCYITDDYALSIIQGALEHSLAIYDLVKDIPDDWKTSGLTSYYNDIERTAAQIMNSGYLPEFPNLYYLISDWRKGNDLFDMIYTYLYAMDEKATIEHFIVYGLPLQISEIYGYVFNAVITMDDLLNARLVDTTRLFYNYYLALDCAQKIKAQEGTVENYIYNNVPINALLGVETSTEATFELILDYIRIGEYGYRHLSSGLLDVDAYDALMKEYIRLVQNTIEVEDYANSEAYGESIKSIFNRFVALSPTEQYNFLSVLNLLYTRGLPELAFDDLGDYASYMSYFTLTINQFMRGLFSEEYTYVYNELILAIEVYANRFGYDEWESDFTARMDKVASALGQMQGTDAENFTYYLGSAYEKYMNIKANIDTKAELGEWADEVDALRQALIDMQTAYYLMASSTTYNYNYFLSSFEKASSIVADILEHAPGNVIHAYYHEPLFEAYTEGTGDSATTGLWTLDYTLNIYRNFYIETLLFLNGSSINLYDYYFEKNLDDFLLLYYEMISAFMNKEENQSPIFDKEKVLVVIEAFKNLDSTTKSLVMTMEGNLEIYYAALEVFLSEAFSENAAAVAKELFTLEANYYTYEVTQSVVTLNAISETLEQLKENHKGLDTSDAASFAPLENIYNYYVEKCEQLLEQ